MSQFNVNTIADEPGTGGPDFVGMPSVGGDPVVASGSNTDGEWVRWADGTQHANTSAVSPTSSAAATWTYPVAFVAAPDFGAAGQAGATPLVVTITGVGPSSASVHTWDAGQTSATRLSNTPFLLATGRWK